MLINKANARNNAADISNIEEGVGPTCFDFATNFFTGAGTCNKRLIFSPPSSSYLLHRKTSTLILVEPDF